MKIRIEKRYYPWIAVGLLIVVFVLIYIFQPIKIQRGGTETEKYLKSENDSLRRANSEADKREKVRMDRIDSFFNEIKNQDWKIIRSHEIHEKIIHSFDTASIAEIEKFFADRYEPR